VYGFKVGTNNNNNRDGGEDSSVKILKETDSLSEKRRVYCERKFIPEVRVMSLINQGFEFTN